MAEAVASILAIVAILQGALCLSMSRTLSRVREQREEAQRQTSEALDAFHRLHSASHELDSARLRHIATLERALGWNESAQEREPDA